MATLVQGVRLALHYGETHLGVTDVFGEDVGPPLGGVFTATQGLKTAWNTPLDERGIVGTAMGIAYAGGRPVFEIQFCDYAFNILDLLKVAGNRRWAGAGTFDMPIVMMTPTGAGIRGSMYHSHSYESFASRLPGWKIVMPSNALDAYGLMLSAIVDPNPVMVLLPKALLRVRGEKLIPGEPEDPAELSRRIDAPVNDRSAWSPDWPEVREHYVHFGVGELVREGETATVISYGRTLPLCVQAADELRETQGFTFDVIDLRSIFPYDWKMTSRSIEKTGRVLLVNEDTEVTNFGEHLLRRILEEHFYDLLVKPRLVQGKHLPGIGLNPVYESNTVPQADHIRDAMMALATDPGLRQLRMRFSMDFALPELGEGVYEAEAVRWLVQPGDVVKRGQPLLEVMTDKATMEVPAPFSGKITTLVGEPGATLKVGQVILSFQADGSKAEVPPPVAQRAAAVAAPVAVAANGPPSSGTAIAAPSVRHLARKLGIDLAKVRGSGPAGRILLDDLTPLILKHASPVKHRSSEPPADFGRAGTRVRFQGIRRRIAEHLLDSKRRIPHYSYVDECDVSDLVRLRHGLRDACSRNGIKLTYLPFFVKAVAEALKEIPIVNSSLNEEAEEIVLHGHYHIGIAVATPSGLIVPVVRDVDKKDLFTIAAEVERLGAEGKAGRARREDLKGSTFTVTSVGGVGGLISTPIINHPEVGIMGVGKVVRRPVYDDHGRIKPADQVYLSFSFDHRVVDGAVGAAFGNAVKRHLEHPAALLVPPKV